MVYTVPLRERPECDSSTGPGLVGATADVPARDALVESVKDKEEEWGALAEQQMKNVEKELMLMDAASDSIVNTIFKIGGRAKLEKIVRRGLHDEASRIVSSDGQPMERLERILRVITKFDIPDYSYLRNETNEVVQAINYYNVRIHPMMKKSGELAPNPAMIRFPMAALHVLPPAVHHTLVCLALNHFTHSLPVGVSREVAVVTRSKIYQHRGAAIRALSQYVAKDRTRSSDLSIASILVFLAMELQNPLMADWRTHADGLNRLIELRGGMRSLMKESHYLVPTLSIFVLIVTMANTSSPSWDQLDLPGDPWQTLHDIESMYNLLFPYTLCPPTLFMTTLRINHLRARISATLFPRPPRRHPRFQPPGLGPPPGAHRDEWHLISTLYQSCIALYCTMTFQSLATFPPTEEINTLRCVHGESLLASLGAALRNPRLRTFLMWPLTVAGVEAGYRDAATRWWISARLGDLSRHLGTSGPLKSQIVLDAYWRKGKRGWDACFDRPYVFIM
ncbi:hypothetical protein ACEQ8H_005113 [Pleosporales sp. CAS-2024a]